MNTPKRNSLLDAALSSIPKRLRTKIIVVYLDLKRNCAEARHDAAGLAAGKFCEAVLRHIQNVVTGSCIPFNKKIGNFADECRKLIASSSEATTESERVILPRALVFLYTMRNKRGIGAALKRRPVFDRIVDKEFDPTVRDVSKSFGEFVEKTL